MTIDEAIYCMKSYLPESPDTLCYACKYYGKNQDGQAYVCNSNEAHKLAIEALLSLKTSLTVVSRKPMSIECDEEVYEEI